MSARWKIDWRGNIVPDKDSAPSLSPRFDTPQQAQEYMRRQPIRVWGNYE
jgi:hypothetical protein